MFKKKDPKTPPPFRPSIFKRRWVVNPAFQLKFAFGITGAVILGQMMVYFGITLTMDELTLQFTTQKGPASDLYAGVLRDQQQLWKDIFISLCSWFTGIVFLVSVLISHRIAGPIYRLCLELQSMALKRELNPIRFRQGDAFQHIPPAFNALVDSIGGYPVPKDSTPS